MHYGRNRTHDRGKTRDTNLPKKRRNALKMVILTKKSKIFIKAKVIFMKSCLLGHVGFMIRCILNNFIFSNAIFRVKGMLYSKTDFKGKISLGL